MDSSPTTAKRQAPSEDGPPSKKIKTVSEVPAQYSDAVRKKLASTSRTGQACDRCKERKMKCDTDQTACQPCRQKNLRCFTTDRVTGQPRERGQSDRAENEVLYLRDQVLVYQTKYGPLQPEDMPQMTWRPPPPPPPPPESSQPTVSNRYVGWPAPDYSEPHYQGAVNGTKVDILDGTIDVCDFPCELMDPPPRGQLDIFNLSRTSIINTIFGFQRIREPKLPSKEEALRDIEHFTVIMHQYVPVVHRPSIKEQVARLYDQPDAISLPERVQIFAILGILAHQTALRNHVTSAENIAKAHRFIHCALGFYRNIYHDTSLPAMQALALLVVHFRNMPKPGVTWSFSNQVLVRLLELQYHRDPDKVTLPLGERTPLAKELRKRVFHCVLSICITTGCRVGLPAPWQFSHLDVPLPMPLCDSEISADGILAERSGTCEFHPSLHLSRLLPLLTELYNSIISTRRPPAEYLRTVDALNTKILAWRQHWDDTIKDEPPNPNLLVATLLIEQWTAEFQINLHHPVCCTSTSTDVMDRHLDMCHKAAKRLLQAFHTLSSKFKGVDFTWHSTAPYAMGFGITLYAYKRKKGPVTKEQYQNMTNELNGWMSLMAYADVVLKTNNHFQHMFQSRRQALDDDYRSLIIDPASTSAPPNPFQSVNGSAPNQPQIKPESTPQPIPKPMPPPSYETMQQPPAISTNPHQSASPVHGPQRPYSASSFPQPPPPSPLQQQQQQHYPSSAPQIPLPHTHSHTHSHYSPYTHQSPLPPSPLPPSPLPQPQHYPQQQQQQIPVSLAPLLNNSNGSFVSYSTPTQTPTATAGPMGGLMGGGMGGSVADYSQMTFNQAHYYGDGSGSYTWPLITLPPGPGPQL